MKYILKARRNLSRQRGVSLTGYALLVGLIGVIAILALQNVGVQVSNLFGEVGTHMEAATGDSTSYEEGEAAPIRESSFIMAAIGGPHFSAYDIGDFTLQANPASLPTARGDELDFMDNGQFFVKSMQDSPYMVVYETGETVADWTLLPNPATLLPANPEGLSFSHDGTMLATGYRVGSVPTLVGFTIYDTSDYSVMTGPANLDRPEGVVQRIAFTNDDSYMIVAAGTPSVTLFDTSDFSLGPALSPIPGTFADDIAVSPDGANLAVLQRSPNKIALYNTTSWTLAATQPASASIGIGQAVAWSPDGQFLAAAHVGGSHLRVWQTSDFSVVTVASPPAGTGRSVAFSLDGSIMAIGHDTAPYLALYDTSDFSLMADPATIPTTAVYSMLFTPY